MLWAAIFAATFFIIYASRTIFIGNTAFGGPDSIKIYYTIFLVFHINLATIGGVLGLIQILRPSKINLIFIENWTYCFNYLVLYSYYWCGSIFTFIHLISRWRNDFIN